MANFKDMIVFGTARFLDVVYAKQFIGPIKGNITGNADTATKATQDANGNNISSTYIKDISGDGTSDTITFTFGDGNTKTFKTHDTVTTIADNLTTNDNTQALAASQGVAIATRLTALETAATVGTF